MSLIEHLQHLPDFRKARGQRHPQWLLLLLLLLGAMSGYWGYRPLAEFTQRYGRAIYAALNLPPDTRLPSYSTFRRLMQGLDYTVLSQMFTHWATTDPAFTSEAWFSCDGKALGATLTHHKDAEQNFVSLVSMFGHHASRVIGVMPMQNKRESEQGVVRRLLEALNLQGVGVTMDALHAQKNIDVTG